MAIALIAGALASGCAAATHRETLARAARGSGPASTPSVDVSVVATGLDPSRVALAAGAGPVASAIVGALPGPIEVAPREGPTIPMGEPPLPIDLATALRLADAESPAIAEARVGILNALALQAIARSLLLPSLNAGASYHGHDGDLQRSAGHTLAVSQQALYVGGGVRTSAAESITIPAVNIAGHLADAIFEPLAARRRVDGARFEAAATANAVLLEVAGLYLDLIAAEAALDSLRRSIAQSDEVLGILRAFAETGQGRVADANRARADRAMLRGRVEHAEEELAVASARLSRRLNLDPGVRLETLAGPLGPLDLIDPHRSPEELIAEAIRRRPDLAARGELIGLAGAKVREERARPLLPTIWLGFSGGAFGGGSNRVPPLLGNFAGRTDFDVRAYWTLLNLGAGNAALIKRRQAELGEATAERARVANIARSEVLSARAESLAQLGRVEAAREALRSAEDGFGDDLIRIRGTVADHPIEVLDSLRLLIAARLDLIDAITRSNQAQFALFVALGSPPPLEPSAPPPVPPSRLPISSPVRSPIGFPRDEPTPHAPLPGPPTLGR